MADFRRRALIPRGRQPIVPRVVDEKIDPSSGWTGTPDTHCLLVDLPGFKKNEISYNVEETGIILVKGRRSKGENKQEFFEKTFNVPEDGDIKRVSMEFDGDTLRLRVPKLPKKEDGEVKSTADASSSNIEEGKKEQEPDIPASSSTIQDKPEKTESPASTKEEEPRSPDSRSTTNGITMKEAKILPPSSDPSSDEKKGEPASSSQQPGNGKHVQQEPGIPREVGSKAKPEDRKQKEEILGQGEKGSKPSVMGKIIENKSILIASVISFTLGVLLSQKFHPPHPQ